MKLDLFCAVLASSFLNVGCASNLEARIPTDPSLRGDPVAQTKRVTGPDGETTVLERRVLSYPDGRVERHGAEREWFPDGTPKSERSYDHERPTGVWRSWYESGAKRAEIDFGNGVDLAPMRFWHPNGSLAGEGMGIAGIKEGPWDYWNEDGSRNRSGSYVASLREGVWSFWHANGGKRAEGSYTKGERSGEWKLWDEDGTLYVKQTIEGRSE